FSLFACLVCSIDGLQQRAVAVGVIHRLATSVTLAASCYWINVTACGSVISKEERRTLPTSGYYFVALHDLSFHDLAEKATPHPIKVMTLYAAHCWRLFLRALRVMNLAKMVSGVAAPMRWHWFAASEQRDAEPEEVWQQCMRHGSVCSAAVRAAARAQARFAAAAAALAV